MEVSFDTIIIVVALCSLSIGMVLYKEKGIKGSKKARKTIESFGIDTMTEEYTRMKGFFEDKCTTLEKEMKHWRGRATRLEQMEDDGTGDNGQTGRPVKITDKNIQENYKIDIDAALPLIKSLKSSIPFLKEMDDSKLPELINNPIARKYAWDYIKKNREEMIGLGVIVPIGTTLQVAKPIPDNNNTSQDKIDGLEFNNVNNEKYMA